MYPTTQWSRIVASQGDPDLREGVIEEIFSQYWEPMYVFARCKGLDTEEARDAVQGCFLRLLEREFLDQLSQSKGRLRNYLLTSMTHFLVDRHEKRSALKRGGAYQIDSLDTRWADLAVADLVSLSPEEAYERAWAQRILDRAFEQLEREYALGQRKGPFAAVVESFRGDRTDTQQTIAAKHQMSISQLKSFLLRARLRLQQLVDEQVGGTIASPEDLENESAMIKTSLGMRAANKG